MERVASSTSCVPSVIARNVWVRRTTGTAAGRAVRVGAVADQPRPGVPVRRDGSIAYSTSLARACEAAAMAATESLVEPAL